MLDHRCCKFLAELRSETVFDFAEHLPKLWTNEMWHVFDSQYTDQSVFVIGYLLQNEADSDKI